MSRIVDTRCHNHPEREAVARCVTCGRFYCRECITEHHDRMICSACLKSTSERKRGRRLFSAVVTAFRVIGGALVLWLSFYSLGRVLVHIPSQIDPEELAGRIIFHP
jgi:hypothetical protein